MTSVTHQPTRALGSSRIISVLKLQFVNRWTTVWTPLLILLAILLMNIAIWALILANLSEDADRAEVQNGFQYSGASSFIFIYMLVVAVQAMNLTFFFAQGFGATRRDYYLGSTLAFVLYSLGYGALLTLLSYLEEWTGGWGLGGRMFTAVYFGNGPWFERLFIFSGLVLFFFMIGVAFATVFVRWKALGLTAAFVVLAAVVIAALSLVTVADAWESVWAWLAQARAAGTVAALMVPTALFGIAGFFILRRATPKS
ncbi:hypothetical protein BH09ACT3_BH09ACT3_09460 [soil metagenome]